MNDRVFIATTGSGLTRASQHAGGRWEVERLLPGSDIRCLAADPLHRDRVYAGTQGQVVLRSDDRGRTWRQVGLAGQTVKAIAASPTRAGVVYAGTKPAGMFVSDDGGVSWAELVACKWAEAHHGDALAGPCWSERRRSSRNLRPSGAGRSPVGFSIGASVAAGLQAEGGS